MIRRRTLVFFAWFSLFGAAIALLHVFLLLSTSPSFTGAAIGPGSAPLVGAFAFLLLLIAFIFFMVAARRVISRPVFRRIALHNVHRTSPLLSDNDIFK